MRKKQVWIVPGNTYGTIKVIERDGSNKNFRHPRYHVTCTQCGNGFVADGQQIYSWAEKGCPHCRETARQKGFAEYYEQYTGQRFGDLTVLGYGGIKDMQEKARTAHMKMARCRCEKCGKETMIPYARLLQGGATQCSECSQKNLQAGHDIVKDASKGGSNLISVRNRRNNKNNSSGHTGVSQMKDGRWRAYINFQKKQYHLGVYDEKEMAIFAREEAEKKIYGNFIDWYQKQYPDEWAKLKCILRAPAVADALTTGRGAVIERSAGGAGQDCL